MQQTSFAAYVRQKIRQLCLIVLLECLSFAVIFAFSGANPMYVIEMNQIQQVHVSFRVIVAVTAIVGLLGMLILTKNLLDFIAASDEFIEIERLAAMGKFSSWTAHQVRNPLAVIRGHIQILQIQNKDTAVQKACSLMLKQSDKITDVLSLMMTLSEPVLLHKEQVDIPRMLAETIESYADAYPQIEFSTRGTVEGVVLGHPGLLSEALKNVITNAVESIDGSGSITATCSETSSTVQVRITDSGPGISDSAREEAFDIGFTTKKHGTGLGLPIVRAILNAHGGSASIERAQADRGTVVTLVLPKTSV